MSKTFVACRPGFKQMAESAFAGMEVEVDPNLDKDYEFRQRELGLADLLEAELESEEDAAAKKADPKSAHTFIIPLLDSDNTMDDNPEHLSYLVVRVDKKANCFDAQQILTELKPVTEHDDAIHIRATINLLNAELKKADIKVHSISSVQGITFLKPVI